MNSVPPIPIDSIPQRQPSGMGASVQVYIDNFVKSKELPPPSQKAAVFQYLDKLRIDAAASRMYKDAAKYQQISKDMQQAYFVEREMEKMRTTSRRISTARSALQTKISSNTQQYNTEIENYKNKRMKELQKIKESHEEQLQEFSNHWKNPKTMLEFAKPSPQLLNLRNIEKKQVILGDYQGAEIVRQRAVDLEKIETKNANNRAIAKMNVDYQNLLRKQQAEIDNFNKRTELQIQFFESQKNSSVAAISTQIRLNSTDPPRHTRKRKISYDQIYQKSKARPKSEIEEMEPEITLATPRTFSKMMEIRSISQGRQLDLDGIDITQHIKKPVRMH